MKFLLGFGIGLTAALMLAPARGNETRERLMRKARNLADTSEEKLDETKERVSEAALQKAGEIGSIVGRQTAEAIASSVVGKPEGRTA